MNLKNLQHLIAVADEQSFVRAAKAVNLSQSALTRSIQSLESDLDMPLFDRQGSGVVLNAAGKLILERARRVVFEAKGLARDAELFKKNELGEVRLGVGPYPAVIMLTDLLLDFGRHHPKMRVQAEVNNWDVLLGRLVAEKLDFIIVERRLIRDDPAVDVLRLPPHRGGLFVRHKHPALSNCPVPARELRQYPLVTVPTSESLKASLSKALRIPKNETSDTWVECNDLSILKAITAKTDAILCTTVSAVKKELALNELVEVPLANDVSIRLEFGIAYLANRTLSPAAKLAIDCASNALIEASMAN